ncbi:hypothetical protein, partial [Streptomyces parvus]|uniref:hypothetical protein n=1 Tax=Streptomyces parvus TaxID=66428 RepID=UPI0035DC3C09
MAEVDALRSSVASNGDRYRRPSSVTRGTPCRYDPPPPLQKRPPFIAADPIDTLLKARSSAVLKGYFLVRPA